MGKETALKTINEPSLMAPMALGEIFFQSGMFADVKSQAQAVVKIIAGKEMGLAPMQAMMGLYMTQKGQIGVMAKIAGAIVKRSGKYDYTITKHDDKECSITFYSIDGERKELGVSTFTFKDAAVAGLANKDVWKNYPRNMLYARALGNGITWYCPDVLCGCYIAEELKEIPEEEPETPMAALEFDQEGNEITTEAVNG